MLTLALTNPSVIVQTSCIDENHQNRFQNCIFHSNNGASTKSSMLEWLILASCVSLLGFCHKTPKAEVLSREACAFIVHRERSSQIVLCPCSRDLAKLNTHERPIKPEGGSFDPFLSTSRTLSRTGYNPLTQYEH